MCACRSVAATVQLQWSCSGTTPMPIHFGRCYVTGWKGHLTASLPISCEAAPSWGEPSLPTVDPPTTERTSRSCDLHVKKTIKRLRTERHAANKLTGPFLNVWADLAHKLLSSGPWELAHVSKIYSSSQAQASSSPTPPSDSLSHSPSPSPPPSPSFSSQLPRMCTRVSVGALSIVCLAGSRTCT